MHHGLVVNTSVGLKADLQGGDASWFSGQHRVGLKADLRGDDASWFSGQHQRRPEGRPTDRGLINL